MRDYRLGLHMQNATVAQSGLPKWLPNINPQPVFMAVPEIFLPPANVLFHKRNIRPVLLHQVRAVLTIFAVVPIVIVAVDPIVIAPFTMMVVSHHRHGRNHGGSYQQPAENEKVFHFV